MSLNVVDKNTGTLANVGSQRIWIGSQASHDQAEALGKLPNNCLIAITDQMTDSEDYSTDETLTNKHWIDGKQIYRKVISIGTLPNSTLKTVSTGITNADKLIHLWGMANSTNALPLPYVNTDGNNIQLWLSDNLDTLNIRTNSAGWVSYTGYAVVEYTKLS